VPALLLVGYSRLVLARGWRSGETRRSGEPEYVCVLVQLCVDRGVAEWRDEKVRGACVCVGAFVC